MALSTEQVGKDLRQIRKLLRTLPRHPAPEDVHKLRSRSRRLEAAFKVLALDSRGTERRLLKHVAKARKQAGKVRDMDVLTGRLVHLGFEGEQECLVRLIEHLGAERNRYARRLHRLARRLAPRVRKETKRVVRRLENPSRRQPNSRTYGNATEDRAAGLALELTQEIASAKLRGPQNLHAYRISVKELRNSLKIADHKVDDKFAKALTHIKDKIGEWHDWEELAKIADDLLGADHRCELVAKLREISRGQYEQALALAEKTHAQYWQPFNDITETAAATEVLGALTSHGA